MVLFTVEVGFGAKVESSEDASEERKEERLVDVGEVDTEPV